MVTVKLLTIKADVGAEDGKKTNILYHKQLIECMRTPIDGRSADFEEIRKSVKILDVLAACNKKTIEFEDADFEYMLQRVKATRWPFIDKSIMKFVRDIEESKKK